MKYLLKWVFVFLISLGLGFLVYHYYIMELLVVLGVPCFNIIQGLTYYLIISSIIFIMLKILILKKKKYDLYLLFIFYLIVLVIGLLFINVYAQAIELNPFAFVYAFFDNPISIVVTLINIIGFIPAYPIIYCIKRNIKFYKIILAFGLAFLVIEFIQYIFAIGVFSLADIFLYFIGFMLGYWATRFVIATDRNDANELP